MFVREVRIKCLRRFFLRFRRSHGSTSLHALQPVSLYFLGSARFLKILIFQYEALQKASAVLLIVLKNVLKLPIILRHGSSAQLIRLSCNDRGGVGATDRSRDLSSLPTSQRT